MKQLKLVLTVLDRDGNELLKKDPAVPQDVSAAIGLFSTAGNQIVSDIVELDIEMPNPTVMS